jgi:hypothetical protein
VKIGAAEGTGANQEAEYCALWLMEVDQQSNITKFNIHIIILNIHCSKKGIFKFKIHI